MSLVPSPDLHSYLLFLSAAKHSMDDAVRFARRASRQADQWQAGRVLDQAERLRAAAWVHLASARELRELAP